mgnify:CR=1 FL=1|jgi:hypothetical protein
MNLRQNIEDELISIAKAFQGGTDGWCGCDTCARWQWLHRLVDKHPCIQAQYVLEQRFELFNDPKAARWWDEFDNKNRATLRHRFGRWLERMACKLS